MAVRRRQAGWEAARRHLAEAWEFAEEMGGADQDVREYFFSLPPRGRDAVLRAYGKKYGAAAEDYARKTWRDWRSGKRGMSGLVAKRLFDLLPPLMPLAKKLELAGNLWRHFAPATEHAYAITETTELEAVGRVIGERLNAVITIHAIPQNVKNRFQWLAQGDIVVEEQILNYFRQLEKNLIMERLRLEIPLLQRQLRMHPDFTHSLKSEFRINNNRITVRVARAAAAGSQAVAPLPATARSSSTPAPAGFAVALAAALFMLLLALIQ